MEIGVVYIINITAFDIYERSVSSGFKFEVLPTDDIVYIVPVKQTVNLFTSFSVFGYARDLNGTLLNIIW